MPPPVGRRGPQFRDRPHPSPQPEAGLSLFFRLLTCAALSLTGPEHTGQVNPERSAGGGTGHSKAEDPSRCFRHRGGGNARHPPHAFAPQPRPAASSPSAPTAPAPLRRLPSVHKFSSSEQQARSLEACHTSHGQNPTQLEAWDCGHVLFWLLSEGG